MLYWLYTQAFGCCRRLDKMLFHDETQPRKELMIEIPLPTHPWLNIAGVRGDEEIDVTELVNLKVEREQAVTPEWLAYVSGEENIEKWEYIDSLTFEVKEITSEGLINEVKPKTD